MGPNQTSDYGQAGFNWGWLVALGILWVIAGVAAILAAGLATLATVIVFGWLLVVTGIVRFIHAFSQRAGQGFMLDLLVGVLRMVVGGLMVARPGAGAVTITLLLAAFFTVAGLYRLGFAFSTRLASRGWIVLSSLVSLALGVMIFLQWPSASVWVIGTFIGIDLVFEGWAMIAGATAIHKISQLGPRGIGGAGPLGV